MLAAVGAAIAWTALRPPSYQATANILLTPLAQEDTQFQGLNAVREAGDPDPYGADRRHADQVHGRRRRAPPRARRRLDRKKVLDAIRVTPEGESNILAVTGKADDATEAGSWPTPSPASPWPPAATSSPSRPPPRWSA